MQIEEVSPILQDFVAGNRDLIGAVTVAVSPPVDAAVFPDELEKLHTFTQGVYLLHRKANGHLLYVGIPRNIIERIYQHIGTKPSNFSWARGGAPCKFPNFNLTQWEGVPQDLRDICQNGQFSVTAVAVEPFEASKLLESLIIFHGFVRNDKPPLNISF